MSVPVSLVAGITCLICQFGGLLTATAVVPDFTVDENGVRSSVFLSQVECGVDFATRGN